MSITSIVFVLIYLAILISIGLFVRKRAKNVEGFAVAGRRLAFYAAMSTIVASEWGGGVVMGVTEEAHIFGISSFFYPLSLGLGLIILGLTLVEKYWHLDTITMGQFLKKRYSVRVDLLAAILMIFSLTLVTASQVRSAGLISESIFKIPFVYSIILFVLIVAIYTSIGGLWAVAYNDTIQLLIGAIGLIIVLGFALTRIGGINTLFNQLPKEFMDPRPYGSWVWAFDFFASVTFVMLAVPELVQRIWGCKTVKIAKTSLIVSGIVYWIFGIISVLIGLSAFVLIPNLKSGALPNLILTLFNPTIAVFLCLSVLAALISTADTMLLVCSTMFVEDIYKRLFKVELSENISLKLMKIMVFVFGALTIIWCVLVPRVLTLILYSMYVIVAYSTIYIFGHIWTKTSELAAFLCLIITAIVTTIWHFGNYSYKYPLSTGIIAFLVSIITIIIFTYIFPKKEVKQKL